MPWWIHLLIQIALKFAAPALINYLLNLKDAEGNNKVPEPFWSILKKLLDSINDPAIPNREAKKIAKKEYKECRGTACPEDIKK